MARKIGLYINTYDLDNNSHIKFFIVYSLSQIPQQDPNGGEIPLWKREMIAKKAAEKAKKEAIEKRHQEKEYRKIAEIPAWKRQLIENRKAEDPKRQSN